MSLRAEHRRNGREAQRRCLTVSDAYRINRMRHLPEDHPSRGLRQHKNKPLRPRMAFPIWSEPAQAWPYLQVIRASPTFKKLARWMTNHPGPQARCTPEVIMLAMFLAAEIKGRYYRSDLCAIVNGLHSTIMYHLGLCDNKTFEPTTYSEIEDQVLRLEQAPFGFLFPRPDPHPHENDDAYADSAVSAAKVGLIRFNMGVLLASVPERALDKIAAASLDATAYPTCAEVHDYNVQVEVDSAIRAAIARGDTDAVPTGVIIGADDKLQRCKYDPQARTSSRSASSETNFKRIYFTGYFGTFLTASRDYHYSHNSFRLRYDIVPYVLGLSCDPATDNLAPIAGELCIALKDVHNPFSTVTADREFTPRLPFVQVAHTIGVDTIMDYQRRQTEKIKDVTVGQREEVLYQSCGDLFPLCLPDRYKILPNPSDMTEEETLDWFDGRAIWRYVPNGPPDANGTRQFICPQCAGHIRFAAKTRMGKYRRGNHPGLSLGEPFDREWCCNGSISIRVEDLNQWQPVPWGTRAHKKLYAEGRCRIENTNNIVKAGVGVSKKSCRAPGPIARNMALLALAVVSNLKWAAEDPLADPPNDDMPEAQLSLFCIVPAFGHTTPNDDHANTRTGPQTDPAPRAPP